MAVKALTQTLTVHPGCKAKAPTQVPPTKLGPSTCPASCLLRPTHLHPIYAGIAGPQTTTYGPMLQQCKYLTFTRTGIHAQRNKGIQCGLRRARRAATGYVQSYPVADTAAASTKGIGQRQGVGGAGAGAALAPRASATRRGCICLRLLDEEGNEAVFFPAA